VYEITTRRQAKNLATKCKQPGNVNVVYRAKRAGDDHPQVYRVHCDGVGQFVLEQEVEGAEGVTTSKLLSKSRSARDVLNALAPLAEPQAPNKTLKKPAEPTLVEAATYEPLV